MSQGGLDALVPSASNPVDQVPAPHYHYFNPTGGELVVHACVDTIKSSAFLSCGKIKKVTFKHTASNPVIIEEYAFADSGVESVDVPPRATFKAGSFLRAYALKSLVFREDSDYQALKIEAYAFVKSGLQSKEVLLCAPLIYASTPASD